MVVLAPMLESAPAPALAAFCYSGAGAGASSCTLNVSEPILAWAKTNLYRLRTPVGKTWAT